ncbi:MAG: hypothetical protein H8E57_05540 [Candidatus Cloacimonetes bacterium]|nr:hypothetical protein [Candidatus Cloacimonadota bacterium]
MAEEKKFTSKEAHQAFASGLFNYTWDLLEKKDRTPEDDEMMVNAAHSSLYHWSRIGQPLNLQRGEWMIAHVYTILSRSEPALYHAKICFDLTEKHNIGDFDKAFALEGYARALALSDRNEESIKFFQMAEEAAEKIARKEDKDYFLKVLKEGPWFGMR